VSDDKLSHLIGPVIDENVRVDVITFTRVTRVTRRTLVPVAVSLYWIRGGRLTTIVHDRRV